MVTQQRMTGTQCNKQSDRRMSELRSSEEKEAITSVQRGKLRVREDVTEEVMLELCVEG